MTGCRTRHSLSSPPSAFRSGCRHSRRSGAQPLQKAIGEVTQTGPVASLFVLNAHGATLADGKLTLTGVSPSSIVFADRPVRAAGHIETAQFVEKWNEGEDQSNIDPPNATVSVLSGADVADAVVTISAPVLEGDNLTFDAVVLEGALDGAAGPAALFIDRGGFGGFHGGGGMGRRLPRRRRFPGGGADHFSNYAHVQDPHAAYYRSSGSNDRAVNYDPHNTYYGGGGYYDGDHPWAAGAAGLAAGAAIGAAAATTPTTTPTPIRLTAATRPIRPATEAAECRHESPVTEAKEPTMKHCDHDDRLRARGRRVVRAPLRRTPPPSPARTMRRWIMPARWRPWPTSRR